MFCQAPNDSCQVQTIHKLLSPTVVSKGNIPSLTPLIDDSRIDSIFYLYIIVCSASFLRAIFPVQTLSRLLLFTAVPKGNIPSPTILMKNSIALSYTFLIYCIFFCLFSYSQYLINMIDYKITFTFWAS